MIFGRHGEKCTNHEFFAIKSENLQGTVVIDGDLRANRGRMVRTVER